MMERAQYLGTRIGLTLLVTPQKKEIGRKFELPTRIFPSLSVESLRLTRN